MGDHIWKPFEVCWRSLDGKKKRSRHTREEAARHEGERLSRTCRAVEVWKIAASGRRARRLAAY